MDTQKIRINKSLVKTYSYLNGNFSEDDFINTTNNNSRIEISHGDSVYVDFIESNNFDIESVCKNINAGVNESIINNLKNGKLVNIKFKNESILNVKNFMEGNFSTLTFNVDCEGDTSQLYLYSDISGDGCQFNHLYNINLRNKSKLTLVIFSNSNSKGFINVCANCDDKSRIEILFVNINKNNVYTNCNVYLNGEESSSNIDACYICSDNCEFDYNLTSSMIGKKSISTIFGKGILIGNSRKIFRGTVDFRKGCSDAEGCENEEVIILSKCAKNKSLPLLLCNEKNVRGSHGFTANSIDKDKVFYLMCRGFSEKEARVLILQGKFLNLLTRVKDDEVIEKFMNVLLECV